MSSYDESEEYDGYLAELYDKISPNDIISVDGVSEERDEYGMYQWMNIIVTDGETGEETTYHLSAERGELSQQILDDIVDYAEDHDAYINPSYGLEE